MKELLSSFLNLLWPKRKKRMPAILSYSEISRIAISFGGYTWIKEKYKLDEEDREAMWKCIEKEENKLAGKLHSEVSLEQLKFELFMYQRSIHWNNDGEPTDRDVEYMRGLYGEIITRTPNEEKLRSLIV